MWPFKKNAPETHLKEKWDMQAAKAHHLGQALLQAAESGAFARASDTIMLGASVGFADESGTTALQIACAKKDVAMIKLLLAHSADLLQEDMNKKSPYDVCLETKDADFIFTTLLATLESHAAAVTSFTAQPDWERAFQDKFGIQVEKAAQALDQKTLYNIFQKLVSFMETAQKNGLADSIPHAQESIDAVRQATETLKPKPAAGSLRL